MQVTTRTEVKRILSLPEDQQNSALVSLSATLPLDEKAEVACFTTSHKIDFQQCKAKVQTLISRIDPASTAQQDCFKAGEKEPLACLEKAISVVASAPSSKSSSKYEYRYVGASYAPVNLGYSPTWALQAGFGGDNDGRFTFKLATVLKQDRLNQTSTGIGDELLAYQLKLGLDYYWPSSQDNSGWSTFAYAGVGFDVSKFLYGIGTGFTAPADSWESGLGNVLLGTLLGAIGSVVQSDVHGGIGFKYGKHFELGAVLSTSFGSLFGTFMPENGVLEKRLLGLINPELSLRLYF